MKLFSNSALLCACLMAQHNIACGQNVIYLPAPMALNTEQYKTPAENRNALAELKQKTPGVKVKLGKIASPPGDDGSIFCRSSFPVITVNRLSFGAFVNAALFSELKQADLYSESDGRVLSIQFETIDFASFGSGKWTFKASLSVDNKVPQTFSYEYPFELSFTAAKACTAVNRAFVPGVQAFLKSIYTDARFQELLASSQVEGSKPVSTQIQQEAAPSQAAKPDAPAVPTK